MPQARAVSRSWEGGLDADQTRGRDATLSGARSPVSDGVGQAILRRSQITLP